jgi:hypothetical protein
LKDARTVAKTAGNCATTESVSAALQAYAVELNIGSEPVTSSDTVTSSDSVASSESSSGGESAIGSETINGTAQLSWVAPVTNEDGSPLPLSAIAGYHVYSGTGGRDLSLEADINDGSATTYTVTGLPSGTYWYAVTAYDYSNNESQYSNNASKTIP